MLYLLLPLLLLLIPESDATAQERGSMIGRRFIIAFPDTTDRAPSAYADPVRGEIRVGIINWEEAPANVTIRRTGGYERLLSISSLSSQFLSLYDSATPAVDLVVREIGKPSQSTFAITSDRDISLYCYLVTGNGSEAFAPLPVESWGNRYIAMSLPATLVRHIATGRGEEATISSKAPAQLLIVAAEDSTQVSITGNNAPLNWPTTLTLQAGEAYQIHSRTPENGMASDLSGLQITASRPIGVISGNKQADVIGASNASWITGSSATNSTMEWLWPIQMHGREFLYRPISIHPLDQFDEQIRVYATAPGITRVVISSGDTSYVEEGSFVELHSFLSPFRPKGVPTPTTILQNRGPVSIECDKPAQVMVVTAPYLENTLNPGQGFGAFNTWAPSAVTLIPRESWYHLARLNLPTSPAYLKHYVTIVADSSAMVYLDGVEVTRPLQQIPNAPFWHIQCEVSDGQHLIRSVHGTFSAVVHGEARGSESYMPAGIRKNELPETLGNGNGERHGDRLLHPSVYSEIGAITYAYPVAGRSPRNARIEYEELCDTTIAHITELDYESYGPFRADFGFDRFNADVSIVPVKVNGVIIGYRIRFYPYDPLNDATATVTVHGNGKSWKIPYSYKGAGITITPTSLSFATVTTGTELGAIARVVNRKKIPLMVGLIRLAQGDQGFSIDTNFAFDRLEPGRTYFLSLRFLGTDSGRVHRDTVIIETDCGSARLPLHAITESPSTPFPIPELGGADWGGEWIVSSSGCSKNRVSGYDTTIAVGNSGSVPFVVRSFELIGPDADSGYFAFWHSALFPGLSIDSGDVIRPASEPPFAIYGQRVRFSPNAEREYSCTVRLTAESGEVVEATLRGSGIESHLEIGDLDFGITLFSNRGDPLLSGTIPLRAKGNRRLTISALRIAGADAASFSFAADFLDTLPNDLRPWLLEPDQLVLLRMTFAPSDSGARIATIEAIGDHSICDDSTGVLAGMSYSPSIAGYDFGEILTCIDSTGAVEFHNSGMQEVTVTGLSIIDTIGCFSLTPTQLPRQLGAGEVLRIPVLFAPSDSLPCYGRVIIHVVDPARMADTLDYPVDITGNGVGFEVTAHIGRGYSVASGDSQLIPIILDAPLDDARVDDITISLSYEGGMMIVKEATISGTLLDGWRLDPIVGSRGAYSARLTAPTGTYLTGTGPLLNLRFLTFIGNVSRGEIPFSVTLNDRSCATVITHPGHAQLDSLCGLNLRLIELLPGGHSYALDQNTPNPFNPTTRIGFSLGLDGHTRLTILNAMGMEVACLVDGPMEPGRYQVDWDASAAPSGLYYYRLTSGHWSQTNSMILMR